MRKLLISLGTLLSVVVPIALPAPASAQFVVDLTKGACLSTTDETCEAALNPEEKVDSIIRLAINLFSIVVGVISVIMIIVGGLRYITSGGESSSVTGAKNTIMYAVIGLVIVAMAQFIVQFVLKKAGDAVGGATTF